MSQIEASCGSEHHVILQGLAEGVGADAVPAQGEQIGLNPQGRIAASKYIDSLDPRQCPQRRQDPGLDCPLDHVESGAGGDGQTVVGHLVDGVAHDLGVRGLQVDLGVRSRAKAGGQLGRTQSHGAAQADDIRKSEQLRFQGPHDQGLHLAGRGAGVVGDDGDLRVGETRQDFHRDRPERVDGPGEHGRVDQYPGRGTGEQLTDRHQSGGM